MFSNESAPVSLRESRIVAAIDLFMDAQDIPAWYRAFSQFQLKAADELQSAIRDDVEQETTHRIRHCLSVLGLVPLLNNKHLQLLMKLSGGNDLAFLWFLMEFHYKTKSDKEFSINEQILLSAIAHLDMVTTLRGLDRVLPQGHLSKRTLVKHRKLFKAKPKNVSMIFEANKEKGPPQGQKLKPYFQKLERPREQARKFLQSDRPDFQVKFREYEKYKDHSYQPPNESNRWFTLYQIRDALRVSAVELRSLFDDFFRTVEFPQGRSSAAFTIIDRALEKIHRGYGNYLKEPSLCLVHKEEEEELETQRQIKEVEQRNKCLEKLDLQRKVKKERIERIHEILKNDVEMYRKQYGEKSEKEASKQHFLVLDKNAYSQHSVLAKDRCVNETDGIKSGSTAKSSKYGARHASVDSTKTKRTTSTTQAQEQPQQDRPSQGSRSSSRGSRKSKDKNAVEKATKGAKASKENPKRAKGGSIAFSRFSQGRLSFAERRASRRQSYYDYAKIIPKQESQIFFQAATPEHPYKFLYENIFNDEYNEDDSEKFIKNTVIEALNPKRHPLVVQEEHNSKPIKLSAQPNVAKAAERYANERWDKELVTHHTLIHDTRKAIGLTSAVNLVAQQHISEFPPDMPIQPFYNCEDKELMHRMLKIGLDALAENHKYVLASIPDAHKLPDLREWIYKRYGKTYTQAERVARYKASQEMLTWLINMKVNVKMVAAKDIARKKLQTYACHSHLRKKVRKFRNAYFKRVSIANMEFARLVWFAMDNYLCSIPQRGMFFSYLPQRLRDLHLINPWKLRQVKNMKTLWEQKQMKIAEAKRIKF